jgi:hypothetical protein
MEIAIEILGTVILTLGPFFGPPVAYHVWTAFHANRIW